MFMTEREIYRRYMRNGQDWNQIVILSQLNRCTPEDIEAVVNRQKAIQDKLDEEDRAKRQQVVKVKKEKEVRVLADITPLTAKSAKRGKRSKYSDELKKTVKDEIQAGKSYQEIAQNLGEDTSSGSGFYQFYYKVRQELINSGITPPKVRKSVAKSAKKDIKIPYALTSDTVHKASKAVGDNKRKAKSEEVTDVKSFVADSKKEVTVVDTSNSTAILDSLKKDLDSSRVTALLNEYKAELEVVLKSIEVKSAELEALRLQEVKYKRTIDMLSKVLS